MAEIGTAIPIQSVSSVVTETVVSPTSTASTTGTDTRGILSHSNQDVKTSSQTHGPNHQDPTTNVDMQTVETIPATVSIKAPGSVNPTSNNTPSMDKDNTRSSISINSTMASDIVRDFVTLKSFDVVSSGQYRKFVLRKKDLCEEWAMKMHDNYHTMMVEVRQLAKYSTLAKSKGHTDVAIVCTKLLNSVGCPHVVTSGWNTCIITRVQCVGGIRVNSTTEATPIMH